MLLIWRLIKEDLKRNFSWVQYFSCHSRACATCLLSHLIIHLGSRLQFKNVSITSAPLVYTVAAGGWCFVGFFVFFFPNFIAIAWLHPCAALRDTVHWYTESKVKHRGRQSPGNEHPNSPMNWDSWNYVPLWGKLILCIILPSISMCGIHAVSIPEWQNVLLIGTRHVAALVLRYLNTCLQVPSITKAKNHVTCNVLWEGENHNSFKICQLLYKLSLSV